MHRKRQMPQDFTQVMTAMPRHDLAAHYKASYSTIQRWIGETGQDVSFRKGIPARNRRPVPDDWAERAPAMTKHALKLHYGAGDTVIDRWAAETGVSPKVYVASGVLGRMGRRHRANLAVTQSKSLYDEAADELRRERFPVNRCNEKGLFDPQGDLWRVGWSILTADELLIRAAKYRRAA